MKLLTYLTLCLCLLASCSKIDLAKEIAASKELIKQKNYKEAEEKLEKLKSAQKNNPRIIVLRALAKAGSDKKIAVLNLVTEAKDLIPKEVEEAESFTQLAVACYMVAHYDTAIELLKISDGLRADDVFTITMLIKTEYQILTSKSSRRYAIDNQYKKIADRHEELNKTLEFFNLSAVIEVLRPEYNPISVEEKLTKAYKMDPKNPAAVLNLAIIYDMYFKKYKRAIGLYNYYLSIVKLLPPDQTKATEVERRLTQLKKYQ